MNDVRKKRSSATFGIRRSLGVAAILLSVLLPATANAADKWTVDMTLSGAGRFVSDDEGRFEERHGVSSEASGGVEDFYLEQTRKGSRRFRVRGHALFDEHDYRVNVDFKPFKKLSFNAGYAQFRTWDDATGGFFPQGGGIFLPLVGEDWTLDRGEAWIHAVLRGVGVSRAEFRYDHRERDGRKGSLVWGDTSNTGGFGSRSIVPSFWDIDERSDTFELELGDRVKNTKVSGKLHYRTFDTDNSRNTRRNPGEVGLDRFMTQRDGNDGDSLAFNAQTESRFKKGKVVLTTGYSYSRVDSDINGSRIFGDRFGAPFSPGFVNRQFFEPEFVTVSGSTDFRLHVGHLNLMLRPHRDLRMTTALRFGKERRSGSSAYEEILLDPRVVPPLTSTPIAARSRADESAITTTFDVRYTGFGSAVLYVDGEWEQSEGGLFERLTSNGATSVERDTDRDRSSARISVGGTWYPLRSLNFAGRYRYTRRDNDYEHRLDSTDNSLGGDRYPAFLVARGSERSSVDLRATWRPLSTLSLVTRYDFDLGTVDSRGDGLAKIESAETSSHVIGTTVSWNPAASLYLQGDAAYAESQTDTPADELTGALGRLAPDFNNDYWSANLLGGWALGDSTDLRARYFFYRSENYVNNSTVSQPFGADTEEHGVSLELSHRLDDTTRVSAGYGFVTGEDDESGGNDDYRAHLLRASIELGF